MSSSRALGDELREAEAEVEAAWRRHLAGLRKVLWVICHRNGREDLKGVVDLQIGRLNYHAHEIAAAYRQLEEVGREAVEHPDILRSAFGVLERVGEGQKALTGAVRSLSKLLENQAESRHKKTKGKGQ